jgi:hypothetical protein
MKMVWIQFLVWIGVWAGSWYGLYRITKSNGKAGWIGHLAGGFGGLFLSLVALAIILPTPQDKVIHGSGTESPPISEMLTVSAHQLFDSYHANEVAADEKFKNKQLLISGRVSGINKDLLDNVYLELVTRNQFMSVKANMDDREIQKASVLKRGQPVMIICTGAGMLLGSPVLDSCRFKP